jgi:hypothetical protein
MRRLFPGTHARFFQESGLVNVTEVLQRTCIHRTVPRKFDWFSFLVANPTVRVILSPFRVLYHSVSRSNWRVLCSSGDALQVRVGALTLHAMGQIRSGEFWHTAEALYPLGFHTSRRFWSTVHPNRLVTYHFTITKAVAFLENKIFSDWLTLLGNP